MITGVDCCLLDTHRGRSVGVRKPLHINEGFTTEHGSLSAFVTKSVWFPHAFEQGSAAAREPHRYTFPLKTNILPVSMNMPLYTVSPCTPALSNHDSISAICAPPPVPPPHFPMIPKMSNTLPTNPPPSNPTINQYPDAPLSGNEAPLRDTSPAQSSVQRDQTRVRLPSPTPVSESDNPDAIALRAAISVLQLQRQQAISDMQKLEEQKNAALRSPELFAAAVRDGHVKARGREGILPASGEEDEESGEDSGAGSTKTSAFGEIPSAQNVIRAPPINWAKYHIVGRSLDRLHEDQRRRPADGMPRTDDDVRRERDRERVIAAPYDPFSDRLEKEEKGKKTKSGWGKKG